MKLNYASQPGPDSGLGASAGCGLRAAAAAAAAAPHQIVTPSKNRQRMVPSVRRGKKRAPVSKCKLSERSEMYNGVFKHGKDQWTARIVRNDGRQIEQLGIYDTQEDAAIAFNCGVVRFDQPLMELNCHSNMNVQAVFEKYKKRKCSGVYTTTTKINSTMCVNYIGVRQINKDELKYAAEIDIDGRVKCLGVYDTPKGAAVAYDNAVLAYDVITPCNFKPRKRALYK